jgi:hypothetical protein
MSSSMKCSSEKPMNWRILSGTPPPDNHKSRLPPLFSEARESPEMISQS